MPDVCVQCEMCDNEIDDMMCRSIKSPQQRTQATYHIKFDV